MRKVQGLLAGAAIVLLIVDICVLLLTDNPYRNNPGSVFTSIVESVGGE